MTAEEQITGVEPDENEKPMSFLEHLDELRRRLTWSVAFIAVAFVLCWFASGRIYNFLAIPINRAIAEAEQRVIDLDGLTGSEKILTLSSLKLGDAGRYIFDGETKLGAGVVPKGTSVLTKVALDSTGRAGLFTEESIITSNAVVPKGVRIPINLESQVSDDPDQPGRMVVTTATEPFMLYVTVSLYAAIAFSVPFLLWQIWSFISPGLYRHERSYVTPFIGLSTISFVLGAAFAYYVLFPPAVKYLLGLGSDFNLMLRATDYFDFITLIMLAMGVIFQMPAVTYVLSRIGLVSAGFLARNWRTALVIILITAAVISPTGDALNLMLFAAPMALLYTISIFIAWVFGKKRTTGESPA